LKDPEADFPLLIRATLRMADYPAGSCIADASLKVASQYIGNPLGFALIV
jgi:hypothetical protein